MLAHKEFKAYRRFPFDLKPIELRSWGITHTNKAGIKDVALVFEMHDIGDMELQLTVAEARELAAKLLHLADVAEGKAEL